MKTEILIVLVLCLGFVMFYEPSNVDNVLSDVMNSNKYLNDKLQLLEEKLKRKEISDVDYRRIYDALTMPERSYSKPVPLQLPPNLNMIPINVNTRNDDIGVQLLGYLTNSVDSNTLKLFGYRENGRYKYYTLTNDENKTKIPIETENYKELYSGDDITVPPYSQTWDVNLYPIDGPKYIPNVF